MTNLVKKKTRPLYFLFLTVTDGRDMLVRRVHHLVPESERRLCVYAVESDLQIWCLIHT